MKKIMTMFMVVVLCLNTVQGVFANELPVKTSSEVMAGNGTEESPYLIEDEEGLAYMTEQINSKGEGYASAYYRLEDDIFIKDKCKMINEFSGVLDGNGKTIVDFKLEANIIAAGFRLAFIGENSGTIKNLGFQDLTITTTGNIGSYSGQITGGIVANDANGTITGCSVIGATLVSEGSEKVGGIVGVTSGGKIEDCYFQGSIKAWRQPAGIVGYARDATVNRCFVDASIQSNNAFGGLICAYPNTVTLTNNVAYGGAIDCREDWSHRIVGNDGAAENSTLENNLANDSIPKIEESLACSEQVNGKDATLAELQTQATYEKLGWNFDTTWRFDEELSHPMLAYVKVLTEKVGLDGEGTEESPYIVEDEEDLAYMTGQINSKGEGYASAYYRLEDDIEVASDCAMINEFSGVLDGNGKIITGFNLEGVVDKANFRLAFIGENSGEIKDLGFKDFTITTTGTYNNSYKGGLITGGIVAKDTNGTITGCSITNGKIISDGSEQVGGIVGNGSSSTIEDCYFQGAIEAYRQPAGIVGYAREATINGCFVDASIKSNNAFGGLICAYPNTVTLTNNVVYGGSIDCREDWSHRIVGNEGAAENSTLENNLANDSIPKIEESLACSEQVNGKDATLAELQTQATYANLGWNFETTWRFDEELSHPMPYYVETTKEEVKDGLKGDGTEASPYIISSEADLVYMSTKINANEYDYISAHYKLDSDITMTEEFTMINVFTGVFDGNGHTIADFSLKDTVDRPNFRLAFIAENSGTIKNLAFQDLEVITTGKYNNAYSGQICAGIAAVNNGTISTCSVINGKISSDGSEPVGGIAGRCEGGKIEDCYFQGTVQAWRQPAAMVGYARNATINRCFIEASVSSSNAYGGLICAYPNAITMTNNVVYDGSINARDSWAHRLIGQDKYVGTSTMTNNLCYDQIPKLNVDSANSDISNGKDTTLAELQSQATYENLGWNFDTTWRFDEKYKRPMLTFAKILPKPDRITVTYNDDTTSSKGFTWYTPALAYSSVLRVSETKDFKEYVEFKAENELVKSGYMHKAVANNLKEDTLYYYIVGDVDADSFSSVATFKTAPKDGTFSFINLADTQAKTMLETMLSANTFEKAFQVAKDAGFILHGGDFVQTGDSETDWENMLNFSSDVLENITLVPAAGNHEYQEDVFNNHFNLDAVNDQDTSTGVYYSFDYSNTHFAVVNTNEDEQQAMSDKQLKWLEEDVKKAKANGAEWVILSMHKGIYTTGTHCTDEDIMALRELLVPLVDELDIDLVLQGHDHILARTECLVYDKNSEGFGSVVETDVYTEVVNGNTIDYAVSPEGTYYIIPATAGAKHYSQNKESDVLDMDEYLKLFAETAESTTIQNFSEVTISEDKLNVITYKIYEGGEAIIDSGFGIDRELRKVEEKIEALKDVDSVTLADEADINEVYKIYTTALNEAQQEAVSNKDKLLDLLKAINKLKQTDKNLLVWADDSAEFRQAVSVNNSTDETFYNVPVALKLSNIPAAADQNKFTVYSEDSKQLPIEIESWNADTACVWVKVDKLKANSVTNLWAYYNGETNDLSSEKVWNDNFSLVEHFNKALTDEENVKDSTGNYNGVVKNDIGLNVSKDGSAMGMFNNNKITYPAFDGGYLNTTVSVIYKATEEDATSMEGKNVALVSKDTYQTPNSDVDSLLLGLNPTEKSAAVVGGFKGIRNESGTVSTWVDASGVVPMDGKSHLVTLCNDGMTVAIYVDGVCVYEKFAEKYALLDLNSLPVTIGGFSDDELAGGYKGLIDEVWITGDSTTTDYEQFKCDNMNGTNVAFSEVVEKTDEKIAMSVGSPLNGTDVESGKMNVSGAVNKPAVIYIKSGDEMIKLCETSFGSFSVTGQFNGIDSTDFEIIAQSKLDSTDDVRVKINLDLKDTNAPNDLNAYDNSGSGNALQGDVELNVDTNTDLEEKLDIEFFVNELIDLTSENVKVYQATTSDNLPDKISPTSGKKSSSLYNKTTATNDNPYQIVEVSLTDEEALNDYLHINWKGKSEREVTIYVYDNSKSSWVEVGSAYDANNEELSIDMQIENTTSVLKDNKIKLLVWRGMTQAVSDRDSYNPDLGEFDFNLMLLPDTQLYAQNYPDLMIEQFDWIADNFDSLKSEMVLSVGDVVNRPYLSQEYQFVNASNAFDILEKNEIPYLIAWGNHDYDNETNNNIMYKKHFSGDRLKAAGGEYFADNLDNDVAYYLMEQNGAKIMMLAFPYWASDEQYEWAQKALESHPDYTAILVVHKYITRYGKIQDEGAQEFRDKLIVPYENVRMVLNGHDSGTNVHYEKIDGRPVYSVVTDYQNEPFGGGGYVRNIKFDIENDLVYFSTYSPISGSTWSGYTREPVTETPGFYKTNMDEFVIPVDFGGNQEKSIETTLLTVASHNDENTGGVFKTKGNETVTIKVKNLEIGKDYEWVAKATDLAGNTTFSEYKTFTVVSDSKADLVEALRDYGIEDDSLYTEKTISAYNKVLLKVQLALEDDDMGDEECKELIKELKQAYNNLEFKPADYSKVQNAINKIPSDLSVYTDDSVQKLQLAQMNVEKDKDITEQDIVDGYAKAIEDAIENLILKDTDKPGTSGGTDTNIERPETGVTDVTWILLVLMGVSISAITVIIAKRKTNQK